MIEKFDRIGKIKKDDYKTFKKFKICHIANRLV